MITLKLVILWVLKILICYIAFKAVNTFCRTYDITLINKNGKINGEITSKLFGRWLTKKTALTNIQSAQLATSYMDYDDETEVYEIHLHCNEGIIKTGQNHTAHSQIVDNLNNTLVQLVRSGQSTTLSLSPPNIHRQMFLTLLTIILLVGFYIVFSPEAF